MMKWKHLSAVKSDSPLSQAVIAFVLFSAAILYCVAAEKSDFFEKTSKSGDTRLFLLCIAITVLFSLRSWTTITDFNSTKVVNGPSNITFLPREQTEEWKGWMQAVILLYHYFGLSNNLPVYQVMRVLVAAYIFLTGYSHSSYFLKTNNFSVERILQTFLRLNLLSGSLSFAVGKSCDFYYFPLLTSIWYMVVYATFRCARTPAGKFGIRRTGICLCISFMIIQASLYTARGNLTWNVLLSFTAKIGGPNINAPELIFRLKLDSLMPYWGSMLALYRAIKKHHTGGSVFKTVLTTDRAYRMVTAHAPWIAAATLVSYFLATQQFDNKVSSNVWHPLTSIIPICAIVGLRNATPYQRNGFNQYFQWLGSISLETYILQSHIWLTRNNKGLLHIKMIDHIAVATPMIVQLALWLLNRLIITIAFLLVCHVTAQATKSLITWLASGSAKSLMILVLFAWLLNMHWETIYQ